MALYATIEPRLIALLNDPSEPIVPYPRLDLPPLDNNILRISGRPSPLESNASSHNEKHSLPGPQQNELLDRDAVDLKALSNGNGREAPHASSITDRALGCTSPQSLKKILDGAPSASQPQISRRRQRTDSNKDDFVQLPQPPKKQKAAAQVVPPIYPPIIIGLFEPPPNAAVLPPIASSSFHDAHGRNSLNTAPPAEPANHVTVNIQTKSTKKPEAEKSVMQKNTTRTRKKWTEEETIQLLLGVQAHGVGNWTKILQDPEFKFDGRRAVDLKDRFRTCCPTELCKKPRPRSPSRMKDADMNRATLSRPASSLSLDSILIESDNSEREENMQPMASKGSNKTRAHRKKLADLAQLGIKEPFKKSQRRERRPFSEKEDKDILQGFRDYGPAWTRILMDPKFDLKSRRPTDLRDRLRNKHPEYFSDDHGKDAAKDSPGLDNQNLFQSYTSQSSTPQETGTAQKEPALPSSAALFKDTFMESAERPPLPEVTDPLTFDWSDNLGPFHATIGDMDLSRILLDDTWNPRKVG